MLYNVVTCRIRLEAAPYRRTGQVRRLAKDNGNSRRFLKMRLSQTEKMTQQQTSAKDCGSRMRSYRAAIFSENTCFEQKFTTNYNVLPCNVLALIAPFVLQDSEPVLASVHILWAT